MLCFINISLWSKLWIPEHNFVYLCNDKGCFVYLCLWKYSFKYSTHSTIVILFRCVVKYCTNCTVRVVIFFSGQTKLFMLENIIGKWIYIIIEWETYNELTALQETIFMYFQQLFVLLFFYKLFDSYLCLFLAVIYTVHNIYIYAISTFLKLFFNNYPHKFLTAISYNSFIRHLLQLFKCISAALIRVLNTF